MDTVDARRLVERYWNDVWRDGRLDVVDEIYTEPFTRHSSIGTELTTHAAYKKVLQEAQRTLARPVTTIDDFAVVDDRIWTRATSRGVNLETSEIAVVSWLMVQRVEADRIAEQWVAVQRGIDWEG